MQRHGVSSAEGSPVVLYTTSSSQIISIYIYLRQCCAYILCTGHKRGGPWSSQNNTFGIKKPRAKLKATERTACFFTWVCPLGRNGLRCCDLIPHAKQHAANDNSFHSRPTIYVGCCCFKLSRPVAKSSSKGARFPFLLVNASITILG